MCVITGSEFILRRPISVADVAFEAKKLTVIFKVFGEGTKVLSHLKTGDLVDIMVPLGNPYPTENLEIDRALLIGGGVGVPPLYYLAKSLMQKGIEVITIIGFQSQEEIFYQKEYERLGYDYDISDAVVVGRIVSVTYVVR